MSVAFGDIDISLPAIIAGMREMARAHYEANDYITKGEQVVYVIAFDGGLVKVGQSTDYPTRLNAHRSSTRTRGQKLLFHWWQRSASALEDERFLLRAAEAIGATRSGAGREWLTGFDPELLVAMAEATLVAAPRPPLVFTDRAVAS